MIILQKSLKVRFLGILTLLFLLDIGMLSILHAQYIAWSFIGYVLLVTSSLASIPLIALSAFYVTIITGMLGHDVVVVWLLLMVVALLALFLRGRMLNNSSARYVQSMVLLGLLLIGIGNSSVALQLWSLLLFFFKIIANIIIMSILLWYTS